MGNIVTTPIPQGFHSGSPKLVRLATYKCQDCGTTDQDKLLPDADPRKVIMCLRCKSGSGLDEAQMYASRKGMRLVSNELVNFNAAEPEKPVTV